jgi:hypothetical protein
VLAGGDQLHKICYNTHRRKTLLLKANHEKMSLYDLITFGVMMHKHFDVIYERIIETRFSQLDEFGARFMRAVSRRGLAVKILLSILSFNIYQMMRGA